MLRCLAVLEEHVVKWHSKFVIQYLLEGRTVHKKNTDYHIYIYIYTYSCYSVVRKMKVRGSSVLRFNSTHVSVLGLVFF